MAYRLLFSREAQKILEDLAGSPQYAVKLRKVRKSLGLLQRDPRYPGLQSHKYLIFDRFSYTCFVIFL